MHPIDLLKYRFGLVSQLFTSAQPVPPQALGDVHLIDLLKYSFGLVSQLFTQPVPYYSDLHPKNILK
jgi:hypothetical protein